jgi:multiple sugar transport system permease protein
VSDISRKKNRATTFSIYALLVIGSVLFVIPFLQLLSTSLKPIEQTMTKEFSLLPRALYAQIGDRGWVKVRRDESPLTTDGYIVMLAEGADSGKTVFLTLGEYEDGRAKMQVQRADLFVTETYACHVIKEVKAGWYKFVEVFERGYSEREPEWTIAPEDQVQTAIEVQWANYREATRVIPFFTYALNTLIVAILGMIGTTLSSAVVAYGFSRIPWKGRDALFTLSIATMMIPFPVTMIPLYTVFRQFGMIGTLQPLWLPCFFASAYNIFLLRQFFMTLPIDISEAARLDGCSEFQIFYKLILPLSKPALIVVALFHFMFAWNDLMGPLIYLTKDSLFTLSLGLQQFQSKSGGIQWHYLMAASTLTILPIIALFFFAQKQFIEGISMTGGKE